MESAELVAPHYARLREETREAQAFNGPICHIAEKRLLTTNDKERYFGYEHSTCRPPNHPSVTQVILNGLYNPRTKDQLARTFFRAVLSYPFGGKSVGPWLRFDACQIQPHGTACGGLARRNYLSFQPASQLCSSLMHRPSHKTLGICALAGSPCDDGTSNLLYDPTHNDLVSFCSHRDACLGNQNPVYPSFCLCNDALSLCF